MPDIKNQFTGGKMNKDLDERLVPKGEYRDAMNIQVSTSDGSDVGAVQNILGNTGISLPFSISENSTCVGSIADEKNDTLYWFVVEPRETSDARDIIFQLTSAGPVRAVFVDYKLTSNGVLKFPSKIITGINIIDDMLFWTDGWSEPKKINIPRSIEGTNVDGTQHTRLINPDQNINYASNVLIEEKHITVIRKSPLKPPTLSQITSFRLGTTSGVTNSLNFANVSGELFNEGDPISIDVVYNASDPTPNIEVGDTLRLLESGIENLPPNHYTARVVITEITPGTGLTTYKTTISTLSSENPIGPIVYEFALEEEGGELFKRKFPRFAYRYKYIDNEYSAIGPFSEVAFVPGSFQYDPTEAYNKGMVNNLKELTLQNFIPSDIPEDVIQVDLLYKNETSPNIYVIKSVVNTDAAWDLGGSYEVRTENIYATLPSNQLLRAWDNVPKNALAQEITGNRIVYGNYTQGYDYSNSKALYSPEIEASISNRLNKVGGNIAAKSIKSSRTYDFGVVYGDQYNRETPVLTVSSATKVVPKSKSSNSNSINISLEENPPLWAEYCKVFVKETSNEYYNLAVDRVYDAEDGNVWLSFPSVDRNKVDEDTYILLKKGIDNSEAVLEEARYKVVAIENEAPEYIKTSYTLISEPNQNITGHNLLGGNGNNLPVQSPVEAPDVGHSSFTINKNLWTNPYSTSTPFGMGLVNLSEFISELEAGEDLYVAFSNRVVDDPDGAGPGNPTYIKRVSDKYLVIGIDINTDGGNTAPTPPATTPPPSNTGGADLFEVHLSKPIPQSDDWLVTSINQIYSNGGQLKPHFYRQRVINKPEFDGRFFVKIEEDQVIRDKVKPFEDPGLDWKVVASNNLYHLIDEDAFPNNGNTDQSVSKTQAQWEGNLKFGGSGGPRAGWFIDHAFYAAKQPGSSNNIFKSTWQGSDPSLFPSFNSSVDWSEQTAGGAVAALVSSGQIAEIGKSNGVLHSDGLYTHPTTSELYFHLSYSILESDPNYTSLHDNWTVGKNDSSFSNYFPNTHTEDQTAFVSNLKAGKYFRIKGNNSVYIITDAYWERLYNYMGYYPRTSNNQSPYSNTFASAVIRRMTDDANKRLRWTIKYELYGAGDSLATNNKFDEINATSAGTLEFLQPFTAEQPNDISTNPAIFETEPKEDTDLDIYYETANSTPLEFTIANREQFIPIGSTLDFEDANYLINNSIPEDLSVIGWGPSANWPTATALEETSVVLSHEIPVGFIPSTLKFVRPDGSWVEAVITSAPTTAGSAGIVGFTIDSFTKNIGLAWFNCWSFNNGVESNRIGDTFNKPFITNGVKVSTPLLDQYKQETRKYGLIYSGIYNSNSGVNNLNQFITAEKITKDINPIHGSIQKLKAGWGQGGDLVALCEDRVLKILANKDALFNADGNSNVTSTNNVLGQAIPYSGEYGISKNPESFASEAYRIYFTDKVRGTVMRLSMDGLTPISNHGMKDWFRDNLKLNSTILGSYDDKKDEYNVTLQQTDDAIRNNNPVTVTFKENVTGWVSFKSFTPENAISCANEYYTFKYADIWKHHDELAPRNTFYNEGQSNSTLNVILNDIPGSVKSFKTINYEGSQSRVVPNFQDNQYYNLEQKPGWYVDSVFTNKESGSLDEFIEKEGKWFNYIKGKEVQHVIDNESDLTRISIESDGSSSFDQASFAIQGLGILGTAPPPPPPCGISGCTNSTANNYNSNACEDDGSCIYTNYGCMAPTASNYSSSANSDDGSCFWYGCLCDASVYLNGCTNTSLFTDYYNWVFGGGSGLQVDDGSCIAILDGCTDSTAFNYNQNATVDDGSCVAVVYGCLEPTANENYNALVNTDDGTCVWRGCTDITANNYRWEGSIVDGLLDPPGGLLWSQATLIAGGNATSYIPASSVYGMQNTSPNPCTYDTGCTDSLALNFNGSAITDDGSCVYCNWYPLNSQADGSHIYTATITNQSQPSVNDGEILVTIATTTPYTIVYVELLDSSGTSISNNALATGATTSTFTGLVPGDYYVRVTSSSFATNNGTTSCVWDGEDEGGQMHTVGAAPPAPVFGCTDALANNYDASATVDNGSCTYSAVYGCTNILAINYDSFATVDDGSCIMPIFGCTDPTAINYDPSANVDDGSCTAIIYGCMDSRPRNDLAIGNSSALEPAALNYNPAATRNEVSASDSSNPCTYNTSASTIGDSPLGPAAGGYGNFLGYDAALENWTVKMNASNTAHSVWAVFNVGDLPLIQWPGYYADGNETNTCFSPAQNTDGTRFSYTTARTSGCQGNINSYIGGACMSGSTGSGFRWYYSNDDGDTWTDGNTLTYTNGIPDQAIKLVRFNKYVSSTCASSKIDWTTYPNGYAGRFKQDARFSFLEWKWNVGGNEYTEQPPVVSQYTESKYVNSGCKFSNYCNYDSSANFPTSATYNPCGGGTPGCLDSTACNFDPYAGCGGGSCTYGTWGVDFVTGACQLSCSQSGESNFVNCCNANPNATNC